MLALYQAKYESDAKTKIDEQKPVSFHNSGKNLDMAKHKINIGNEINIIDKYYIYFVYLFYII